MQTFIFQNVLCNYTRGIAISRATSKEEAIQLLLKERDRLENIKKIETQI
jgi:hypothetical protein